MNFKLDENIPLALTQMLKSAGHQAETVYDEHLAGASDAAILQSAVEEKRVLIAFDLDFADVRTYPLENHFGIIVFRLNDQRWRTLCPVAQEIIDKMSSSMLEGALAIVEPGRVRYRRANK